MRTPLRFLALCLLLSALNASAQTRYILAAAPADVPGIAARHGLTVISELYENTNCLMLVSSSSVDVVKTENEVESDVSVLAFEPEQTISVPELSGATLTPLLQSTSAVTDTLPGRTLVNFFGSTVPSNYTSQTALNVVRLNEARNATHLTGAGTIAIIDTGVDFNHPALSAVLLPGYDFTRDSAGASELADLDPATAAALQQSTSAILGAQNVFVLNPYTAAILDQSTSAILGQSTSAILGGLPDFGHGTMVAGVVHLIAPTAKIMPLKAFHADGTSNLSDIIRAIYYAVDHGANIVSMSFSIGQSSPGLQTAIQYALGKNVALVAAAGNDGQKTLVFPASYGGVHGIGSTSNTDVRSSFSNYGSGVTLFAAPGEGVITTFPGGLYAAGWGTSFSAPMYAGAASLVLQARPMSKPGDITNGLSKTKQVSDLGYGRIDLYLSLTNVVAGSSTSGTNSGSKP